MQLTYLGHSSFQLQNAHTSVITDPFIRANALASSIDVAGLRAAHMVLSHGHGDHIADAVEIAQQSSSAVYCAYEIASWLEQKGLQNLHGMNIGGSKHAEDGFSVSFTQALHSSTLPDGSNGGSAMGAMIQLGDRTVYFAGDTDIFRDMELLSELYHPEIALLPIGDVFTMGARHAAKAAAMMQVETVIGMHYDTFPPICIDHDAARKAFRNQGVDLILLKPGETFTI